MTIRYSMERLPQFKATPWRASFAGVVARGTTKQDACRKLEAELRQLAVMERIEITATSFWQHESNKPLGVAGILYPYKGRWAARTQVEGMLLADGEFIGLYDDKKQASHALAHALAEITWMGREDFAVPLFRVGEGRRTWRFCVAWKLAWMEARKNGLDDAQAQEYATANQDKHLQRISE